MKCNKIKFSDIFSLKNKCLNNKLFNSSALFLFDELLELIKFVKRDEFVKQAGIAKHIAERNLKREKEYFQGYVKKSFTLVSDGIESYNKFFLSDGMNHLHNPKYDEISKYWGIQNPSDLSLNDSLYNFLISRLGQRIKLHFFPPMKCSEIMALLALYWLRLAAGAVENGYLKGKRTEERDSFIQNSQIKSFDYCLMASEAILKARKLKDLEILGMIKDTGKTIIKKNQ